MIKVLIADSSHIVKKLIRESLDTDPGIKVIGLADNGQEAYNKTIELKPDIVIIDYNLPQQNILETIKMISNYQPTPIIILSVNPLKADICSELLKNGAVAIIEKPKGFDYYKIREILLNVCKTHARLIKRLSTEELILNDPKKKFKPEIICIGSSTGGLEALIKVLSAIKIKLEVPIIIIQHITEGYNQDIVKWLKPYTLLDVKVAENDELISNGVIYLPKDGAQLLVKTNKRLYNSLEKLHSYICPSVDITFESVASVYGENTLGILLTGMGKDGAYGMEKIYQANGYTIAQDKNSSVVFGMPKAAIEKMVVKMVLPIDKIGEYIIKFVI